MRTVCGGGNAGGARPATYEGIGLADNGVGAFALTIAGSAADKCAWAGTVPSYALPLAVALAGATMVTLLTFVTLFTRVVLCIRMPTFTTGAALVTTAGAVPIGAGMINPSRDPGGAGTN